MAHRKELGITVVEISETLEISRSHLYVLEKKYSEDPTMADKDRSGRPSKVDDRALRRIRDIIEEDPFAVSGTMTVQYNFGLPDESKISSSLFRTKACELGLPSRRPSKKPPLNQNQITDRLTFAENYLEKDLRYWRHVIFVDEASLKLRPKDNRVTVRRPQGERYSKEFVLPSYKHEGGSLMFWGCIGWSGQGILKLVEGTLTGRAYAELLEEVIPPSLEKLNL